MSRLNVIIARMRGLLTRQRLERELNDEVRFHLEMQTEDNLKAGRNPAEARNTALRSFGGIEPMKESCRERRAFPMIESVARDIRYAVQAKGQALLSSIPKQWIPHGRIFPDRADASRILLPRGLALSRCPDGQEFLAVHKSMILQTLHSPVSPETTIHGSFSPPQSRESNRAKNSVPLTGKKPSRTDSRASYLKAEPAPVPWHPLRPYWPSAALRPQLRPKQHRGLNRSPCLSGPIRTNRTNTAPPTGFSYTSVSIT